MPLEETQPVTEPEEQQLCISCTAPNPVDAHFCKQCGAPLSPYSMIGPFERLLAEGFIYRRAAEQPRRLITVIGIWVLFGVPGLTCLLFAAMSDVPEMAGTAVLGIMPIISLAMIWKTTRNYINRKKHFMFEEEA